MTYQNTQRSQLRSQPTVTPRRPAQVRIPPQRQILSHSQRMKAVQMPPRPQPQARPLPQSRPKRQAKADGRKWLLIGGLLMLSLFTMVCGAGMLGLLAVYGGGILPNVSAAGVDLGGLSEREAATRLRESWTTITLVDGTESERVWRVDPARLGISIDAEGTAARAYDQGRGDGSVLVALKGVEVEPMIAVDLNAASAGLESLLAELEAPAVNAGVRLVDGDVQATSAQSGRMLNLDATLAAWERRAAELLADGELDLVMVDTAPTVTDSAPMVEAARGLLTSPLSVRVFDPVTGDIATWSAAPDAWAPWITAQPAPESATGLALSVDSESVRQFLTETAAQSLDTSRYLDYGKAVEAVQAAVRANTTTATIRVYHHDRQHTVQQGETIISIAWDYGVPYPWIEAANPGVGALSVGQTLTIPSPDNFFQFEPVPDKRVVVSISQQRTWVYENGALKWEWVASTGINSSPTWRGIYQIISHEPNAYAANWDLWMPNFMGVYQPLPGQNFTNGFHGFPTREGGQLLWENSLGTRVTYGCILLSSTNAQLLYDWAENGVVVEIQP